ncbi:MAG TPA: hypothetical protein VKY65_14670 [Alphaproteobacteria bacterium]|nr:hypothetical protein [Alphaproteobacteria bacterium]
MSEAKAEAHAKAKAVTREYKKEANRLAAEFLEFNAWIDSMLGVEPTLQRWPYDQFRPGPVKELLERIKGSR